MPHPPHIRRPGATPPPTAFRDAAQSLGYPFEGFFVGSAEVGRATYAGTAEDTRRLVERASQAPGTPGAEPPKG